jgi:archaellum component FlaC
LVNAFIDLAVTCSRYENYLASIDLKQIEATRSHWQQFIEANVGKVDAVEMDIAKKNFAIINKRIERVAEIRRYLKIAYGQVNLIENSFQLLADQIVTMQSPNELSGQLDELLDGVESIKETAKETEQILRTL